MRGIDAAERDRHARCASNYEEAHRSQKNHCSHPPANLYDEWIECAESCYAQAARGDAFARLFGELCNIASAIKIERGKLVERIARQLDLPSRKEVDTLNRQVRFACAARSRSRCCSAGAGSGRRRERQNAPKAPPKKPASRARKNSKRARP